VPKPMAEVAEPVHNEEKHAVRTAAEGMSHSLAEINLTGSRLVRIEC
jgi:hypothetical protein